MFGKLSKKNDNGNGATSVLYTPASPLQGRPRIGWMSPEYRISRRLDLDPGVLKKNGCVSFFPETGETEFYRVLRSRILKSPIREGGKTIMVTSSHRGEGKTLTSINLALSIAREHEQTVLLVDCDLRKQSVHRTLGLAPGKGLADYLIDGCPISEIMIWPGIEKLTLICGGRDIQESCELLGSQRMKELVEDMRSRYPERYVLFDVPPVFAGADALDFAPHADHIIFVVEAGRTQRADVLRALDLLPRDKIAGLVLNRQSQASVQGYGRYDNPYDDRPGRMMSAS